MKVLLHSQIYRQTQRPPPFLSDEHGRCLIWNQLNNLRTPLDELYVYDPGLADHFSRVSRALENADSRADSSEIRTEGTMT